MVKVTLFFSALYNRANLRSSCILILPLKFNLRIPQGVI